MTIPDPVNLLQRVRDRLAAAAVFDRVEVAADNLRAYPKLAESQAWYEVSADDNDRLWVGLYTPDRWLSESIEADLMHQGDKIEDLLEDELIDQGFDQRLAVDHFRDEELRYVFRSRVEVDRRQAEAAERLARVVLAYDACFSQLGDMSPQDETV